MEPASSKPQLATQSPEVPLLTYSPDLTRRVADFANASSLAARNVALIRLVHWTRRSDKIQNLAALVEYLEHDDPMRARFQSSFACLLHELRSLSLLAEAGIPYDHSLMAEITQRVAGRLVPSAREDTDTSKLLIALYSSEREVHRFLQAPEELYRRLVAVLAPPDAPDVWSHQRTDLQDALRLLASRVSGRGLEPEMRDRSSPLAISESPFYRIGAATDALITASDESNVLACLSKWTEVVSRCRWEMVQVHRHMESAGVSVELIFDLKKIEACLNRMEMIVEVLVASTPAHQLVASRTLMFHLMEGRLADRSLRLLLRDNLNLIARKMVERTGRSGEHYIAHDRAEYWHMWRAALGGGLLTVITAAFKLRIVDAHLPPFAEGFLAGTNYAVSFVLLQILGLVLATKQPAATAATFAGIIRDNKGVERSSKLTDFVAHITSTQLAAAIGNVSAVTVGAIAFEWLWTKVFGASYLPPESATHVYETLHPFASGTAVFAIITGVILWMAALAGGWFENFAVYYRLDDAIAQHPLGLRVGERWMRRVASALDRNLGGWSTSIVLGYLLGFTPEIGRFFGIPLDVRHVTLSTGTLALAVASFGTQSLGRAWFYFAVEGIAVIFVLNLGVSFMIAAYVALRAYDVRHAEQWRLLRFLVADAIKSPLRFVWPEPDKPGTTAEPTSAPEH
jgi:site-specific recombinase